MSAQLGVRRSGFCVFVCECVSVPVVVGVCVRRPRRGVDLVRPVATKSLVPDVICTSCTDRLDKMGLKMGLKTKSRKRGKVWKFTWSCCMIGLLPCAPPEVRKVRTEKVGQNETENKILKTGLHMDCIC